MPLRRRAVLGGLSAPFLIAANAPDTSALVMGGTGGGLGTLRSLGAAFTRASGIPVTVVPSLGTAGGVRALEDGKIHLAFIGRSLTDAERARGLSARQTWRTALGFVTSNRDGPSLGLAEVIQMIADERSRWPDGTPVRPLLRPATESDYPPLFAQFPGMEAAIATLRKRMQVPVASTDQEALNLAEQIPGSLVAATLAQVVTELRNLRFVAIDGVAPTVEALESGRYRATKGLDMVYPRQHSPQAAAFLAYVASSEGSAGMRRCGFIA